MKPFLLLILSLCFAIPAFAQADSGFTHKSEAKNKIVNGLKEGKWLEYLDETETVITDTTKITDTGIVAKYYRLTIYKAGKHFGIVRYYYKYSDGEEILFREIPYSEGKINGVYKEYYPTGALHREYPYTNGKENGLAKDYLDSGDVKEETKYLNGKAISTMH